MTQQSHHLLHQLEELHAIGIALSSERDINRLLETILVAAKRITHADAGTLYLVEAEQQQLKFEIIRNDTLGITLGGTTGEPIPFHPIRLYDEAGQPNHAMVVTYAALSGETVNIPDAYAAAGYDFSGTKVFDHKFGYRSTSFLTVPMRNHENEIIGVLQLINAQESSGQQGNGQKSNGNKIVPFSESDQHLLESLASQAAVALTNRRLIKQMEDLFESFINLINTAIDDKSAYTGGHCQRVPELTMMLAEAVNRTDHGPLKDFVMTDKDRYELKIAGLLHDCGKITTPVHVVDKATKLHTLFDRIHLIETRFEVLKRDAEILMLRENQRTEDRRQKTDSCAATPHQSNTPHSGDNPLSSEGNNPLSSVPSPQSSEYQARIRQLDEDREFLRRCNIGSEKMAEADQARVQRIAAYRWCNAAGEQADFLSPDELENITIPYGTLTAAERQIINHHIEVTIKMLEALPWPKHLKSVAEYAGGHHERMDGKGYPRGLTREQMSVQARVMGIADIFEALTAKDRPYKKGKTLTESLVILGKFKLNGHIDPDLFDVFVREKVYLRYAQQFLDAAQIDTVDESRIPGYTP